MNNLKNNKIALGVIILLIVLLTALLFISLSNNSGDNNSDSGNEPTINSEDALVDKERVNENLSKISELGVMVNSEIKLEDIYSLLGEHIESEKAKAFNVYRVESPEKYGDIISAYRDLELGIYTYESERNFLLIVNSLTSEIIHIEIGAEIIGRITDNGHTIDQYESLGEPNIETVVIDRILKEYAYTDYGLLITTMNYHTPNLERVWALDLISPLSKEEFQQEYTPGTDARFTRTLLAL